MLGTVSLHSCKKLMGGAGAENTQECRWAPEMVVSPRREHHFRLGGCAGRPRVPEGGSGGLPELMLALRRSFWSSREFILDSSKVIFELPRVIFAT